MTATRDTEPWEQLLDHGRADERLVHEGSTPPQNPLFTPLPDDLDPRVADALQKIGIDALYTHQRDAYDAALNDGPTIVTTGTASGKSLCFQLPTLEVLTTDPKARALYLYPTKALAQDQARAINAFGLTQRIHPAIYDGDTPRKERPQIRRRSNLVITNPDMLHVGILPHHAAWADMFANLAFVVVDEAHVYRGVFGSHVANVLRRLRRAAALYGTAPRFLLASATIANPLELARGLTGLTDIGLVDNDSAARPSRRTVIWNPPLLDEALGVRGSPLAEAAELLAELVSAGARTICFMKSRKGVELILRMASDRLPAELAERLAPYRGGYTPAQRHEIERRLVDGELLGVVATDALELGIDIGSSTLRSASPSPGPSRACGRCGAALDAAAVAWRSTSPARTRSTSSSPATRRSSYADRWRRRSSTPPARRSATSTCSARPTRRRSPRPTRSCLAPTSSPGHEAWPTPDGCASAPPASSPSAPTTTRPRASRCAQPQQTASR